MTVYGRLILMSVMLTMVGVLPIIADNGVHSGETDGYTLVWNDEFNKGTLDHDAWNIETNGDGGGNAELQYYTADNISVGTDPQHGNGCLILTARRESYKGKSFTSGRLNTSDNVIFTNGKIESRIKMPKTANGLWPAFWLLGADYKTVGWPRCGEIDIVEVGNAEGIRRGTQDRFFNGACHWGFYNSQGQYPNYARSTTNSYSIEDGEYHLFTLIWDEENVRMYLDLDKNPDAQPYYQMGVSDTNGDWATGNYFQHDFFIIYDLAVGGYFTGIVSPGGITAVPEGTEKSMYVDWVRVYQKADNQNAIVPATWTRDSYDAVITEIGSVGIPVQNAIVSTAYYDLNGRRISCAGSHSVFIRKDTYADGRTTSTKIMK